MNKEVVPYLARMQELLSYLFMNMGSVHGNNSVKQLRLF